MNVENWLRTVVSGCWRGSCGRGFAVYIRIHYKVSYKCRKTNQQKMKINMNSTRNLIANHKNKNNEDIIKQTKHLVMLAMLSEFCFFQCLNTY